MATWFHRVRIADALAPPGHRDRRDALKRDLAQFRSVRRETVRRGLEAGQASGRVLASALALRRQGDAFLRDVRGA